MGSILRTTSLLAGVCLAGLAVRPLVAQELGEGAVRQIQAILADKATRTPAQRKLATSLLMASRHSRGEAMVQGLGQRPRVAARAGVDEKGMVLVDIKAAVTEDLLRAITDVQGELISSHPSYGAVRARLPIRRLEALAARPEIRFVRPALSAARRPRASRGFLLNAGSATSEGDVAHTAADARVNAGVDGSGTRVCLLSDGVDSLADRQATNDLPPTCATPPAPGPCVGVLAGEEGAGDYGTANLEIIHDLAPGAQLFFATSDAGTASFAQNIQTLQATFGCDIMVDDAYFFNFDESAFQDGPIAQAVNAVAGAGTLYFTSAGDNGRQSAGTSGTWEGDFVDSGTAIPVGLDLWGYPQVPVHSFNGMTGGSAATSDPLSADAFDAITLQWSDPWGGATNDYDLFLLTSDLQDVVDWSVNDQECPPPTPPGDCSTEPFEIMDFYVPAGIAGERVLVTQWSGDPRALRVATHGGGLTIATSGAVFGHSAAENARTVAATDVITAGGGAFTGGGANPVETYSSDGPRRMFYNPNGTAITPGNLLFGTDGGRVLQKPDVTAADCVTTTTPDFTPFCATSAAAAHAAGIAALLKSTPNNPSGGQAVAAMFATALDVDPSGRDDDSGVGIVMADAAAGILTNIPAMDFFALDPCRVFDTREPGGPTSGSALTCGSDYEFTVIGGACAVPASASAVSLNVTVTDATAQGNVRLFASGAPAPLVSALNYVVGLTRANNAVAPISAAGKVAVRCAPAGTVHVIVDVNGYFQ